jgi:hypothetical protein
MLLASLDLVFTYALFTCGCGTSEKVAMSDGEVVEKTRAADLFCRPGEQNSKNYLRVTMEKDDQYTTPEPFVVIVNGVFFIKLLNGANADRMVPSANALSARTIVRADGINGEHAVIGDAFQYERNGLKLEPKKELIFKVNFNDALRRGVVFVSDEVVNMWSVESGKYSTDIFLGTPDAIIRDISVLVCPP